MIYFLHSVVCEAHREFDRPEITTCKEPVRFRGCSMDNGECVCGKKEACLNPYPYRNHKECEKEKKGKDNPYI